MRFHVVGLPFSYSPTCAYGGKVDRFIRMMRDRGHDVYDYPVTEAECDPERQFNPTSKYWRNFNARVVIDIKENAEPGDFLCVIAGRCQQQLANALPELTTVEFGVGYGGVFADFCVYESYAWMHTVYGSQNPDPHAANGRFYDAVIPNYFDVADFPAGQGGDGYAFLGRLIERKGFQIAADTCERIGALLTIAGEGKPPSYGDYLGVVGPTQRAKIMGSAKAVFVPTLYVEPFGGVAAEAMLCGTPVITTDFGAFTETVVQGVTGWRCRTMGEFQWATQNVDSLDRNAIREYAINKWSLESVAPQYEAYFDRLHGLRTGRAFDEASNRPIFTVES